MLLPWSSLSDIGVPEVFPLPVHDAMAASGECRRAGSSGGISLPNGLDISPMVLCHLVPDSIVFIQFLLGWWRYWGDFLPERLILFLFFLNPLCLRDWLLLVVGAVPLVVKDCHRAIDAEAVAVTWASCCLVGRHTSIDSNVRNVSLAFMNRHLETYFLGIWFGGCWWWSRYL